MSGDGNEALRKHSPFSEALRSHEALDRRRNASQQRLADARQLIQRDGYFRDPGVTLFVAGSLGRGEVGERSDLDLFLLATKTFTKAAQKPLIASVDEVIGKLGYPPIANRRYVKVYDLGNLLKNTGAPQDDSENCFTARMLLLLESAPLVNDGTYRQILDQVLGQYFRDERGKASYRPLFLLNDVLRYWRTLCLNYEDLRHDARQPWWKKNINLKFSRMLTVFATVSALTLEEVRAKADFEPVCILSPHARLARSLDALQDEELLESYQRFLADYETFLRWKEDSSTDARAETREFQDEVQQVADRFSDFLHQVLTHKKIPESRRKYLVI